MATRKRRVTIKENNDSLRSKAKAPSKQTPEPPNDNYAYMKLYVTLIGAFLFSCFCTSLIWYFLLRDKMPMEYIKIKAVQVETLTSPDQPFVKDAIHREKPLIIRNSFVNEWPALKKWSPKYLASKEKKMFSVYSNDNEWFGPYYDFNKPMAAFTSKINNYKTNLNLSSKKFIDHLTSPAPNQYIYYTGSIDQFGAWALEDIMPYSELLIPNPAHSSINVWIGQPGVTAHCHYDGYHNFYAQLYGTKRFVLFNPSSFTGLYPYPFLHPSHAQTQVNFSNYSHLDLFPSVKDLVSYVAILGPGDMLYIPPLWYHHVEAVDVSMSVNVWTDTQQTTIMNQVFEIRLPVLEIKWNGEHLKAIGSSVILYKLVERVCEVVRCPTSTSSDSPGNHVMYRLWSSRYRVLMDNTSVLYRNYNDGADLRAKHRKSLLCENDFLPDIFYEGLRQKMDGYPFDEYLSSVSQLIAQLPHNTWETWFSNYIEFIAFNSVPLKFVGVFIKHYDSCIRFF